jgi:hypothetical protein
MYEVNKKPGIGFLEVVYQEALEIELKKAEIPYESGNNQSYSLIHPCLSVVVLKSELLCYSARASTAPRNSSTNSAGLRFFAPSLSL